MPDSNGILAIDLNRKVKRINFTKKPCRENHLISLLAGNLSQKIVQFIFQISWKRRIRTNKMELIEVDGNGWELVMMYRKIP